MHYGVKMEKNWGRTPKEWPDFDPQRSNSDLNFWVPDYGAKFHRARIATTGEWTDRQTDVTDVSEFIICPMLCYSNGTDKNCYEQNQQIAI